MIERKIIADKVKEFQIKEFVANQLGKVGLSDVKLQKTPLGEKIIIAASRPGLVVGRAGANITKLTKELKKNFSLENPQIEIEEVQQTDIDSNIIAEMIAGSLERFGSARFKGIGHKAMSNVMNAKALGVEILISGKIPSSRAKTWRFYQGYLKKCGDISISGVDKAYASAKLKTGIVGIKVSIMPSHIKLPDNIQLRSKIQEVIEEVKDTEAKEIKEEIKTEVKSESTSKKEVKVEETKVEETEVKTPELSETKSSDHDQKSKISDTQVKSEESETKVEVKKENVKAEATNAPAKKK
jgi:small subunit ribosomal protein S3